MRTDYIHPDRRHIVDCGAKGDGLGDCRRARLKTKRRLGKCRLLDRDTVDHVATAKEWRHLCQNFAASPEHPDPVRPVQFMRRKDIEISTKRTHIHRHVNNPLASVNNQQSICVMGNFSYLANRKHRPQNVRDMRNCNDTGAVTDHVGQMPHHERAILFQRKGTNNSPCLFGNQRPGHNIRMVIGDADQNFVTRLQPWLCPAAGDQVQRHRRTRCQDNLVTRGSTDEAGSLAAHRFIQVGRGLREEMQPAMHIRISVLIGRHQRVQHLLWLLRRRRTVQINQRLAMNAAFKNRKVRPNGINVKGATNLIHHRVSCSAIHASATGRRIDASVSLLIVSIVSIRNASISIARATSCGIPRLVR